MAPKKDKDMDKEEAAQTVEQQAAVKEHNRLKGIAFDNTVSAGPSLRGGADL